MWLKVANYYNLQEVVRSSRCVNVQLWRCQAVRHLSGEASVTADTPHTTGYEAVYGHHRARCLPTETTACGAVTRHSPAVPRGAVFP